MRDIVADSVAALWRDLESASRRLPQRRAQKQQWSLDLTRLATKIAAQNREEDLGERKTMSREIAHERRRLRRKEAVARLAANRRPKPRINPCHSLQTEDGVDLVGLATALEAIELHIEGKYDDDGTMAIWALRMVVSEVLAATLEGTPAN